MASSDHLRTRSEQLELALIIPCCEATAPQSNDEKKTVSGERSKESVSARIVSSEQ
jgi:hypothetical protein